MSTIIKTPVQAAFNKLSESGKSALVMIRVSKFQFGATPVYVPAAAVCDLLDMEPDELVKGMSFEIPAGFSIENIVDTETGEIRTTRPTDDSDPVNLKQLVWSFED